MGNVSTYATSWSSWWHDEKTVLLFGLDNAGKTSILWRMKENHYKTSTKFEPPTTGSRCLELGNISYYDPNYWMRQQSLSYSLYK